ncbi:DUF58 domain-containing protein [Virgibacillus sp. C22-A2]|uniref:DUF58 domain-containing protein n=1 Tax=Virgibacillus tibetensis TaxID=3042313 RepID=A0ABU6KI49_9BACI|nr:DUF58 domain-containing protein [Virgibacillus sp. C22-A2]
MMWLKEFGSDQMKSFDNIVAALVVFFLIGIIFQNSIAFIGVGVFTAYLIIFKVYDKSLGEKLILKNPRKTIKLFPGEDSDLTFELENQSVFPLINGEFKLQTGPAIKAYAHVKETDNYWSQIKIPLSIFRKRKTVIEIPVVAEQRGVSKVNNITFVFPHLFNFDSITLKYKHFYYTEFVVFPKLLPVKGVEAVFQMIPGSSRSNFSPFEDIQSPLGTRDYSFSDPFHRINWKASVKSQKLQTNVYEKVVDRSFVFIVNLGTEDKINMASFNQNLENLLSYTAYLSKYATEARVPYEIFINARKPGPEPFIHLDEGEGKNHYGQSLEMLARIHKQSVILPFNQMLHRIGKQFFKPKTIILIGEVPPDAIQLMDTWKQAQYAVFQITSIEDGAILNPLIRDTMTNAK